WAAVDLDPLPDDGLQLRSTGRAEHPLCTAVCVALASHRVWSFRFDLRRPRPVRLGRTPIRSPHQEKGGLDTAHRTEEPLAADEPRPLVDANRTLVERGHAEANAGRSQSLLTTRERGVDEAAPQTAAGQVGAQTETDVEERFAVEPRAVPTRRLPGGPEADEPGQRSFVVVCNNAAGERIEQCRWI